MTDASLQYVPDYAAALLVRGRIQLAEQQSAGGRRDPRAGGAPESSPRIPVGACRRAALAERIDEAAAVEKQLVPGGCRRSAHARALSVDAARGRAQGDAISPGVSSRSATRHLHARRAGLGAGLGRRDRRSLGAHGPSPRRGHPGRPPVPSRRSHRRRRRPATQTPARWARKARALHFTLLPSELGVLRTGIVTSPQIMRS